MGMTQVLIVIFLGFSFYQNCFARYRNTRIYELDHKDVCEKKSSIEKILHIFTNGIQLGSGQNSAVIIRQIWDPTRLPKIKTSCQFTIKSKIPNSGIYIVVTKLKFRKDNVTNTCIDYIEFSQSDKHSNRTCDEFDEDKTGTQLLFNSRGNKIDITVYIDSNIPISKPLELNIVATAHFQCHSPLLRDEFQCETNNQYSCISKLLVDDTVKNCMPPCDEINCSIEPVHVEIVNASNIAISAITSLIFTMVSVGTCVYICWKYKDCMNPNDSDNSPQRQNEQIQSVDIPVNNNQSIDSIAQRPPSPKDDLPPSYESLFPDR